MCTMGSHGALCIVFKRIKVFVLSRCFFPNYGILLVNQRITLSCHDMFYCFVPGLLFSAVTCTQYCPRNRICVAPGLCACRQGYTGFICHRRKCDQQKPIMGYGVNIALIFYIIFDVENKQSESYPINPGNVSKNIVRTWLQDYKMCSMLSKITNYKLG